MIWEIKGFYEQKIDSIRRFRNLVIFYVSTKSDLWKLEVYISALRHSAQSARFSSSYPDLSLECSLSDFFVGNIVGPDDTICEVQFHDADFYRVQIGFRWTVFASNLKVLFLYTLYRLKSDESGPCGGQHHLYQYTVNIFVGTSNFAFSGFRKLIS